jgi:hypothetical protein
MKIRIAAAMAHSNLALATVVALRTYHKLTEFQQRMPHSSREMIFQKSAPGLTGHTHGHQWKFRCTAAMGHSHLLFAMSVALIVKYLWTQSRP